MQPLTEVMECRHSLDVQVRFNDYDMFCHLNNGAYMQFLDLGKTDYFGHLLGGVLTPERLSIVIAGITCNLWSRRCRGSGCVCLRVPCISARLRCCWPSRSSIRIRDA